MHSNSHLLFSPDKSEKTMQITNTEITVAIAIADDGSFIGLNTNNDLIVGNDIHRQNLGPFTQKRAKELGEYLQLLASTLPER